MAHRRTTVFISTACAALMVGGGLIGRGQQAPRILIDQSPRAVEYQLNRLSNDELVLVERNAGDVKYRPIYFAFLTRRGLAQQFRDEAIAALVKLDKSSRTRVVLDALGKVRAEDATVSEKLIGLLLAQPASTLKSERDTIVQTLATAKEPLVLRGGYAALMAGDGQPDAAWQLASKQEGHLVELIRATSEIPASGDAAKLRGLLFTPIAAVISDGKDSTLMTAAVAAIGYTRADAATFDLVAQALTKTTDVALATSAVRSLQVIPESAWPQASIAPLARAIVVKVGELPSAQRTEPATLDMIQFGDKLAAKVAGADGAALRRDLRALGVQVVRIQTLPEKLSFDVRWFAVEAGKAVQIALVNPDAMPHNLVVGRPGSLEQIGTAGGAMPMPTDPNVKPFVPSSPDVITATNLVREGDTERLAFAAPKVPGEYIFVCTFPGHWVRMYGVMLVVDNLEAWEAKPTVPIDPMTKQPFTSQRN